MMNQFSHHMSVDCTHAERFTPRLSSNHNITEKGRGRMLSVKGGGEYTHFIFKKNVLAILVDLASGPLETTDV